MHINFAVDQSGVDGDPLGSTTAGNFHAQQSNYKLFHGVSFRPGGSANSGAQSI